MYFFFNFDPLHARLNCHYKALSYKEKKQNKIKAYRKSLPFDLCVKHIKLRNIYNLYQITQKTDWCMFLCALF